MSALRGRLRAVWHILRGHSVMFRVIVNYGPPEDPRFCLAHYKDGALYSTECEFAGIDPWSLVGEAKETRKEANARMAARPHVDDAFGRWDTSTW